MSPSTPQSGAKIGAWWIVQNEDLKRILDPSWSVIRAAVVLASRNLQAELADLEAWHERTMTDWYSVRGPVEIRATAVMKPEVLQREIEHGSVTVVYACTGWSALDVSRFFTDLSRCLREFADIVDRSKPNEFAPPVLEGLH